jgi:hypothetical protein
MGRGGVLAAWGAGGKQAYLQAAKHRLNKQPKSNKKQIAEMIRDPASNSQPIQPSGAGLVGAGCIRRRPSLHIKEMHCCFAVADVAAKPKGPLPSCDTSQP